MRTFAKGLGGVVAAETHMSYIDGERGILEYVGIPIGELAANSTFEEPVFLLWNRRLPKGAELEAFKAEIRSQSDMPRELVAVLNTVPKSAQPMHVMRTLVSALGLYDLKPNE